MALREGAALHVLAGEAHPVAFEQERTEGERFASGPIEALAGLQHLLAVVEEALDRAVDVEALRHRGDLEPISRRRSTATPGLAAARIVHVLAHGLEAGPAAVEPIGLVGLVALSALELAVELGAPRGLHLLDLGLADDALVTSFLA
jgi:hypothetical protein